MSKRSLNGTSGAPRKGPTRKKRARNRATAAQQAARLAILRGSGMTFTDKDVEEIRKEMDG